MKLNVLLSEKRASIQKRWFEEVVKTYPEESARFLQRQKNQFANPVGYAISEGLKEIFSTLLNGLNIETVSQSLDNIIRVRAVQDFTPSEAVGFIFLLKKVLREELKEEIHDRGLAEELSALYLRLDELALLSFDIYMKCRERLYEIKANELRSQTFRLLEMANLICGSKTSGEVHEK